MSLPKGYHPPLTSPTSIATKVCQLNKSLYGLKHANRKWYSKLSNSLISLGYKHSNANYSLFTKYYDNNFTTLLVYVDDLVLTANNLAEIHHVKAILHNKFHIKYLGRL